MLGVGAGSIPESTQSNQGFLISIELQSSHYNISRKFESLIFYDYTNYDP